MSFILRAYDVTVQGWVAKRFYAATPQRARVRCWRAYQVIDDRGFGAFLGISTIKRVEEDRADFGVRVHIGGAPAYLTGDVNGSGSVGFVRDDSDTLLFSHPSDVVR